jgi:hypothetical protein
MKKLEVIVDTLTVVVDTLLPPPATMLDTTVATRKRSGNRYSKQKLNNTQQSSVLVLTAV